MDHDHDYYDRLHADRVKQSLEELQYVVKEHDAALAKLRASSANSQPSFTPGPETSLGMMKVAYDELATKPPFLAFPESVLPAMIALRKTSQTVDDTKAFLSSHDESMSKAKRRLEIEQSNLKDQQGLSQSLQNRIQTLREGLDNRMEMGPEDIARERINVLKQTKKKYDKETARLLKALRNFIDDSLASMLAAEELGGPVVGDMMDIDGENLAAGFSGQGRPKKVKETQDQDKRQRRIDEIWGHREPQQRDQDRDNRDESTAAGAEMRELTEELLNGLMESDGDNSAAYVQLSRESAAARFLIRSKVAQFHPKDSTKLRLVDFGRELDS
ncbi:uncharacterized protein BCR38DRAFT_346629 [Pseudomassariella vexata]|uniref:Uncharacterized protein n=1 Tax=Pseudomassariella vexata TaxID=1141098 RepID=A0A1Y2DSD0_9PEZI|nr:uncharacterized protein BCR38DRAFT_346629 [Pseudomassariella vexata]ORY62191.1 hypothetical protein BCR38DRAFT_346629 [Pseudomassariella vexata]